jgi:hypothetical protein
MPSDRDFPSLSVGRGEKLPASRGAGLTEKGRKKARAAGHNLKAPTRDPNNPRHVSFCKRSAGWHGERGRAARKRWGCRSSGR